MNPLSETIEIFKTMSKTLKDLAGLPFLNDEAKDKEIKLVNKKSLRIMESNEIINQVKKTKRLHNDYSIRQKEDKEALEDNLSILDEDNESNYTSHMLFNEGKSSKKSIVFMNNQGWKVYNSHNYLYRSS